VRTTVDDIHHWNRNVLAETPPTYLYKGNPSSFAAAFAAAKKLLK
jgi:hypothetical protein